MKGWIFAALGTIALAACGAVPGMGGQTPFTYENLVGDWGLSERCENAGVMRLEPGGQAFIEGQGEGVWALDRGGRLVIILSPPRTDRGDAPTRLVRVLSPAGQPGERLRGQWDDGQPLNAPRCGGSGATADPEGRNDSRREQSRDPMPEQMPPDEPQFDPGVEKPA